MPSGSERIRTPTQPLVVPVSNAMRVLAAARISAGQIHRRRNAAADCRIAERRPCQPRARHSGIDGRGGEPVPDAIEGDGIGGPGWRRGPPQLGRQWPCPVPWRHRWRPRAGDGRANRPTFGPDLDAFADILVLTWFPGGWLSRRSYDLRHAGGGVSEWIHVGGDR
jgi:hypothetical protein